MRIDIWSDVVCPFCYLGKRRLEAALADFEHADEVEIHWHSFELDPQAPATQELPLIELLARKYGMPLAQAEASQASLTKQAAAEGLVFNLAQAQSGNTFNAHRLIHFAADTQRADAMKERLLLAYFTEHVAIGDPRELGRLAVEVGLDAAQVDAVLASDGYADDVRADEQQALELGITGVPFLVLDGRLAISGAQPRETFARALEQAWSTREPQALSSVTD